MKGKYAARATLRREDSDVQSQLDAYQHNIKRLTGENTKLKNDLATTRAEYKQEARRLKAQLDEGLSPELLTLRSELEHQRERSDQATADSKDLREKWWRLTDFTMKLLHDITGCTGLEAHEAIAAALGGPAMIIGAGAGADLPATEGNEAAAKAIQRRRGYRSPQKVVDHLNAICASAAQKPENRRYAR